MDWVHAGSSGILLLMSIRIEVALGNGVYNGHILNIWHKRIWFAVLCYLC
jgi:hypothetical protein